MSPENKRLTSAEPPRLSRLSPFSIGFFGCLGAMLAYGLALAALQVSSILLIMVVSMFLALGLNPAVSLLSRWHLPRPAAVAVVFVVLLAGVVAAVWAVAPVFTSQVNTLITNAPGYLTALRDNPQIADLDRRFQILSKAIAFLTSGALVSSLFGGLLGAGKVIANVVFAVLVTLVLTLYFLSSLPAIKATFARLAPASKRHVTVDLIDKIFTRVGAYLGGMFVVVSCAGLFAFVCLEVMGLGEYALALAVMVAMFAFIPFVGPAVNLVTVAIIAFSSSTAQGVAWVICYLVYVQIEGYVILPWVMSRSVKVPAAISVIAALILGSLLGLVGVVIAVPTAAIALLLYREVLVPKLDAS